MTREEIVKLGPIDSIVAPQERLRLLELKADNPLYAVNTRPTFHELSARFMAAELSDPQMDAPYKTRATQSCAAADALMAEWDRREEEGKK